MNYCPECGAKLAGKTECGCGFVLPADPAEAEPSGSLPTFPAHSEEYYRNAAINLGFIKPGDDYSMISGGIAGIPDENSENQS